MSSSRASSVAVLPGQSVPKLIKIIVQAHTSKWSCTVLRGGRSLRVCSALATGAQQIHQAIDHLAHLHRALLPPRLAGAIGAPPTPIPHQSNRWDNVPGCGHSDRDSPASTSGAFKFGPSPLNHK